MKRYINLKPVFLCLALLVFNACDKDFEEINTNPNVPNSVTPDLLLPNVIRSTVNEVMGTSWGIGNIVIQQTAKIQFVNEDRYQWGEINGIWSTMYTNLRDVNNIYAIAEKAGQSNYMGISLVMKSWMMSLVTDCYGDAPYSEAAKGKEKVVYPKFDTQEEIYNGILADLATANDLLGSTAEIVSGDILFGGNVSKWKKLANSLRLRYLMRISNRRNVGAEMQAILTNPTATPIFTSNDDNAALQYLPTVPNQFPLYTSRIGSVNEFRLSKTMGDKLQQLSDPRLQVFARPTPASAGTANPVYVGVPNGLDDVAALQYNGGANFLSRIGPSYYIDGFLTPTPKDLSIAKGIIMTYPELQFILAEAAQKGLITGTAKDYYEAGVTGSFNYYGLTVPVGYLEQTGVAFNPATALELIGTQKWIALFYTGLEAWFDWRRTNVPALTPGASNVNGNRIPVRFIYPSFEFSLNKENVEAAIARQGGVNDINNKVWWDQ
ncbi:SusD/RagB family nutrient-binding outer membrane lipoprotein [Rhodocytophaga rosea]|uniref:SusD/RagB family nutrient-binding outer membrane lipoprotein n=1 Tax=Rhodocytophaga rosea TaxID=2704465 RepID=A0A6C0GP63_9BACT|nr:SusD/RagB family nutrient-binding outer membrane lipoprotein [Rhodocytophaga rosea]QHT69829.1 SusD/RagB family nutrient-binding outer membrane lipoprotein [Rhodocytophaga rosea]